MMKNITMNLKHLVLTFTLAIFAVAANAVNVTYSLTTHVDKRLITGEANLNVGDNLENKMPTALWRGYTHYTFYKDANKTQAITTLESGVTTVYVDYVFDPPFQLSDDTKTVWNYFRNAPGTGYQNYLYYGQYKKEFYSQNNLTTGNMTLKDKRNAQWAFYGDAYSLNMKFNDYNGVQNADYLLPTKSSGWFGTNYSITIGNEIKPGWQLYENTYSPGFFSLGFPDYEDRYLYIYDGGGNLQPHERTRYVNRNGLNKITVNNPSLENGNLLPFAFVVTPASSDHDTMDFWHVTFKIQKEDGTMYPDYVMQKHSLNPEDLWPPTGFTPRDGYEYDRFYTDANFTQKLEGNMPDGCNTVLYIKETPVEYVAEQWKTLVLPYSIENLNAYFGEGGVRVLEYTSVEGQLNGDAFRCNLIFTPVDDDKGIEAYKPYLFKADHVSETVLSGLRHTVENMGNPIENFQYDTDNAPNIRVSMLGVLADGGYNMPQQSEDGRQQNFFFGSYPNGNVENYEDYTYKFYRQGGVTIPQFVCYFYVTDERPGNNAPIKASFGTESITGVSTIVADIKVQNSIYSLDGRKIDATSLDNLKRGIYIVNGRKVVK